MTWMWNAWMQNIQVKNSLHTGRNTVLWQKQGKMTHWRGGKNRLILQWWRACPHPAFQEKNRGGFRYTLSYKVGIETESFTSSEKSWNCARASSECISGCRWDSWGTFTDAKTEQQLLGGCLPKAVSWNLSGVGELLLLWLRTTITTEWCIC